MIDVRELRVGNYVTDESLDLIGCTVLVENITDKGINITINPDKCRIEPEYTFEQLKGVYLTGKILSKCGFEINKGSFDTKVATLKSHTPDASPISIVIYGAGKMVGPAILYGKTTRILHLHQLQNLYFDLTGQELEITF